MTRYASIRSANIVIACSWNFHGSWMEGLSSRAILINFNFGQIFVLVWIFASDQSSASTHSSATAHYLVLIITVFIFNDLGNFFLDENFEARKLARRILKPSVPSDSQCQFMCNNIAFFPNLLSSSSGGHFRHFWLIFFFGWLLVVYLRTFCDRNTSETVFV